MEKYIDPAVKAVEEWVKNNPHLAVVNEPLLPDSGLLPDQEVALARTTDPTTSWEAMGRVNVNKHEQTVLDWLAAHGDGTILEIVTSTGEAMQTISPRFAPLRRKGLIESCGKRKNSTGASALVWRLTARGHEFACSAGTESLLGEL